MEYHVGDIVSGEVTGIQSYGAFIKLSNGEQGLIHISEISTYFVKNVSSFVQVGQIIKVKIIDILEDKQLYRLSLKQVTPTLRQNVRQMKSSNSKKRSKIPLDQQDYTPLKNNLAKWIEEGKTKYGRS
ncbi:MAG: CvfD/Ygs/GSP13 family RNA-binding post-transcriptional regulator [Bacillales bacterium]|nr:CvfD/Ygs/GSP13 family RNA-binding post-transcriptional regulator [Bacillales bacterium]